MGILTTHVLDTALGRPAGGVKIEVWRLGAEPLLLATVITNTDGRVDKALLAGESLEAGVYELRFHAGDYLRSSGLELESVPFLDIIPICFGVADASQHYHVPLLLSPYGYSTYRGS
jgi:5-hydroxyisourate hydrolase